QTERTLTIRALEIATMAALLLIAACSTTPSKSKKTCSVSISCDWTIAAGKWRVQEGLTAGENKGQVVRPQTSLSMTHSWHSQSELDAFLTLASIHMVHAGKVSVSRVRITPSRPMPVHQFITGVSGSIADTLLQ